MSTIGAKATGGFFSFLFRNVLARGLGIIALVILSRQLSPLEFGMVSLTEAILSMIAVFGNTGINEFLQAYTHDDYDEVMKASFWLNILLTLVILVLFLILLPWFATSEFPQQASDLIYLSFISGGIFVFTQLQIIPKSVLGKQLEFKKLVKVQNPFTVLIPVGKILCAIYGMGVYSLVVPTLILTPIQTFWFFKVSGVRPSRRLYLKHWGKVYKFTRYLIGSSLLARITDEGDKFILAKFLSLEAVGIYNLAYQLSNFVGLNVTSITNSILSSVLPHYKHDISLLRSHYFSFLKVIGLLCFPLIIGMAIMAQPLITAVNGIQWVEAVLPFQILSIYALVRTYTSSYGAVMNTLQMPSKGFVMSMWLTPFHLTGTIIGSFYGAAGLSVSVTVIRLVFTNIGIYQVAVALQSSFKKFYFNLRAPLLYNFLLIPIGFTFLYYFPNWEWIGPSLSVSSYSFTPVFHEYHIKLLFGTFLLIGSYILFGHLIFRKELVIVSEFINKSNKLLGRIFNFVYNIKNK